MRPVNSWPCEIVGTNWGKSGSKGLATLGDDLDGLLLALAFTVAVDVAGTRLMLALSLLFGRASPLSSGRPEQANRKSTLGRFSSPLAAGCSVIEELRRQSLPLAQL